MRISRRAAATAGVFTVVAAALLAGRLTAGHDEAPTAARAVPSPSVSVAPTTAATATPSSDDGENDAPAAAPTTTTPPPAGDEAPVLVDPTYQPDVRESATAFGAAWLNVYAKTAEQWRAALTPRVTASLAEDLGYADPDSVPASAKVGRPVLVNPEGQLFTASVPVVQAAPGGTLLGDLHLTLLRDGGRWLVSEIDWEKRR